MTFHGLSVKLTQNKKVLLVVESAAHRAKSHKVWYISLFDLIAQKLRLITSFILFFGAAWSTWVIFFMFYKTVPGRSTFHYWYADIPCGTNDLPKNINPLHNLGKVHRKCLKLSNETKVAFPNIIIRKDKNNLHKHLKDANIRKKNFCKQKYVALIDKCNLEVHHLGTKKLNLNNKNGQHLAW